MLTWPASIAWAARSASKRSCSTTVAPKSVARTRMESPPTWQSGMQASQRSSTGVPRWAVDPTALQKKASAESRAPFGRPVVPDV